MPRKSRKPKKQEDPKSKEKNEDVPSTGISSSRQDESNSARCSSYSSASVKNEESSTDSERHEKVVSDVAFHYSDISEEGKSSDEAVSRLQRDVSPTGFLEAVKKNDNEGNLKTDDTDAPSADISLLIQGRENVERQEEGSVAISLDFPSAHRAFENESVREQVRSSAEESHSESSDVTKLPLDLTMESNASIKADVISGPQFAAEASRHERTIHQEKTSDDDALSPGSAAEGGNEIKEIKEAMKDDGDSTCQEDLNPRSIFRNCPANQVEGESTAPGPLSSSLGAVNIDPQFAHYTKKGRGKTGVPLKHTSEVAANENKRKRTQSTTDVSSKEDKGKSRKQRAKSEPMTKAKSKLLSKKKSGKNKSPGTSFSAEGNIDGDNYGTGVSHQEVPVARRSSTCCVEEQGKSSLNVSLRKRKSTEYVASGSSKSVLEEIPPKRMQRGSETSGSSARESKTSPRAKNTSPRTLRKRQNKSNSELSVPKPCRTVTTSTESMTEYVGDAAFIAVGESPPRKLPAESASSESPAKEKSSSKYKVVVYGSERQVTTQTESVREYLIFPEDSLSNESQIQPMMDTSSIAVPTVRDESVHTESSPDRNLNMADKPTEVLTAERSPTISSSESIESDINTKQESMTYRGARPKTRGKNIQETSPQKRYEEGHDGDILTIHFPRSSTETDHSLERLSKEDVKETDDCFKQSSSTNYMGARPKTCLKKTKTFSQTMGGGGRSDLAPANAENQTSIELLPSFEEFKETLGVDKVEVVDINFDVFDKALGIDRSSDHTAPEYRQDFKIISPKRFSEAMSHDNGDSTDNKAAAKDPQSSEMVEQNYLPTLEEFRRTLRNDEIPPLFEDASEILNKALEEMESKRENLQPKKVVRFLIPKEEVPSTSKTKKSSERRTDSATSQKANRGPVPGILAFSGYRKRASPIGLAVPDCFDLKAIANALDEILRLELENRAGEVSNDPHRPEVTEDSEESIEDINRAIAKSGMKLKRSQVLSSSDDEITTPGESNPVEVTLHSSTQIIACEMHRDISETSRSSNESLEECNPNSSEYREVSSESLVESSESDEK